MNPTQPTARNTRLIAGEVVLVAIALLVVGVHLLSNSKSQSSQSTTPSSSAPSAQFESNPSHIAYKDGTYIGHGEYDSPGGVEHVTLTVTIKNEAVADTSMTTQSTGGTGRQYQDQFITGYTELVIGKKLDDIHLSRVSGSSLTSGGFNDALAEIKNQAKG